MVFAKRTGPGASWSLFTLLSMEYVRQLQLINKNDTVIAGGKAAALGEMIKADIPVPSGFVILTSAYEKFLADNKLDVALEKLLQGLHHSDMHAVEDVSKKVSMLFENARIPEDVLFEIAKNFGILGTTHVAVRSSAVGEDSTNISWAGQFDSYLNTTEKVLLKNIRRCWSSLFTPRAIAYRLEKQQYNKRTSMAVVIQKMVESEVAGVAFSAHPVSGDTKQLLIEANLGLGESVVSGSTTPDSYVVGKSPRRVIQINISEKHRALVRSDSDDADNEWVSVSEPNAYAQALRNDQILELADLVIAIEEQYGFPCDVEWAFKQGKFYVLQSRPITTLIAKEKYHLHYTVSDLGILHHNILLVPDGYGRLEYQTLVEKGIVRAYLSEEGISQAREHSKKLLDKNFFNALVGRAADMNRRLVEYEPAMGTPALPEWDRLVGVFNDMWSIYFYCEQPMQMAVEEMILKKEPDSDCAHHVLETLGRIKLQLHESTENLLRKGFETFADLLIQRYQITKEEFYALLQDEVRLALQGIAPPVEEVRARLLGCIFLKQEGSWQCVTGKDFAQWKKRIEQSQPGDIVGAGAYPGIAKGRVAVHLSWTNVREIPEGSILVTGMTNPQIIPYLKNTVAIVTDEGGLTCHAAIISRELKIPCVVGTKTATRLLEEGDLVEVNAYTGAVTILERISETHHK